MKFLRMMQSGEAEALYGRTALAIAGHPVPPAAPPSLLSTAADMTELSQAEQRQYEAGGPVPAGATLATSDFIVASMRKASGDDEPDSPRETDPRDPDTDDKTTGKKKKRKGDATDTGDDTEDDESNNDTDAEDAENEETAAAQARGRDRIREILECDAAKSSVATVLAALVLAFETELPRGEAISILTNMAAAAGTPAPGRGSGLRARMAAEPVVDVGDGGAGAEGGTLVDFIVHADKKRRGER